jgi:hypothetical protein
MKRTKQIGKAQIVSIELKVHQTCVFVYVRRRFGGSIFEWKVYQHVTLSSVKRIARLAERIVLAQ